MALYDYDFQALDALAKKDETMAQLIAHYGKIEREVEDDPWVCLIKILVSQQISSKAAAKILERIEKASNHYELALMQTWDQEQWQACGIGPQKQRYLQSLMAFASTHDLQSLLRLDQDTIATALLQVKGLGMWSVEMFLLFGAHQNDVLSYADLGIRKGIEKAYGIDLDSAQFAQIKQRLSPYGTIASFYFWRVHEDR